LACFTHGGWRFIEPIEALQVLERTSGLTMLSRNGAWETGIVRAQEVRIGGEAVLRARQPPIAEPAGGSVVDIECRSAVASLLNALRCHGLIA
jgi:hypothetical protein